MCIDISVYGYLQLYMYRHSVYGYLQLCKCTTIEPYSWLNEILHWLALHHAKYHGSWMRSMRSKFLGLNNLFLCGNVAVGKETHVSEFSYEQYTRSLYRKSIFIYYGPTMINFMLIRVICSLYLEAKP